MGRDLLSRAVYASRVSVLVGTIPVLVSAVVGTALGIIAGYLGGWYDKVIMRLVDLQLAFPLILVALVLNTIIGVGFQHILSRCPRRT